MFRPRHPVAALAACALAAWSATAVAHQFWVEPSSFALPANERVGLRLCIGDGRDAWPFARDASRIVSFQSVGPAGRHPVPGLDGVDPAGIARFTVPGDYVVAYESNHAYTEQPAAQFDEYLRDEGLDTIAAARRIRGDQRAIVREAYSRHAKALLTVGQPLTPPRDRLVGLQLELLLEAPETAAAGTELRTLRLLYRGQPLGGALVRASTRDASPEFQSRTDPSGRVSFALRPGERWRITAVHMLRGGRDLGTDWESLWASLTFELPAAVPARRRTASCGASAAGSSVANSSSTSHEAAPPPPPPPEEVSPQVVSPATVVPARLRRNTVPEPQRPPLVVVPMNSVPLS
jgi:uncharacterized GH25 family protein